MAKPPPTIIADFEIIRRLGSGGMAEVFLAKKRGAEGTFKLLVLKRILPAHGGSRRFRTMFVEEAHVATRLNHPNIVQVYEFSDHGEDGLLLSMEYVEGFDLGKLMAAAKSKEAKIPPLVAAFIVSEAAKGLHYAHERKDEGGIGLAIVHRDVSPQNILLSHEGVVKIADFGIASANLFREEPGVLKGKFGYMSPEQARAEKVDRRSDIYALGVVFYELCTLRSPYGQGPGGPNPGARLDDDALLDAVKNGRFEPPSAHVPDVPAELEAIVLRAMSKDAADRFQTARDMAGAIARVLLAKQELVDNASVEATLAHLLGRDLQMATIPPGDGTAQPQTMAAVPRRTHDGEVAGGGTANRAPRAVREVRHVAVVTVRVQGIEELEAVQGKFAAKRSLDSIRAILDDIAYKRGALLAWVDREHPPASDDPGRLRGALAGRAVVGLLANPSRAAADSASFAIDVHEALAGASEDLPVGLRAAIGIVRGIATGERDEQGHLVHHALQEPANFLADQLGARTPFGKTWVAGGVYRLVRRDFRWGDAPPFEVDDAEAHKVPPQMRLFALQRPLTREERMAELAIAPNDLVGRDAEKADLHAAFHRAVSGSGQPNSSPPPSGAELLSSGHSHPPPARASMRPQGELVARAIVGEMGIGKTALVANFLAELPAGVRVHQVECSPVKSELPLATVTDLLRDITGVGPDQSNDEATSTIKALLGPAGRSTQAARFAPRLAEIVTGKQLVQQEEEAAYRRELIVTGVRYLLGAIAMAQPLVLVIDGLQWADRSSLELLQELLRRTEHVPVLTLLVSRPEERTSPFIEGLVRIELRGLSADEQMRLVEARLGVRDGVSAVCAELVPRVAGNPFFLLEMIDALLERGTLEIVEREDSRHELVRNDRGERAESLPSTLEQLIGDRLRELPPEEHDVVDWLAVAGGPLLDADLLSLTRLADDEAITRLCARGLCDRRGGAVDFRHPLARDVAYLALDTSSRVRMHRRLGEHLATTPLAHGLSAAIVARHLARGEAPVPAAELYLEAADAARGAHQAQLAQRYYQRALSLLPAGDTRRMKAHEALEAIYRSIGRRRERRAHLSALRKLARDNGQARFAALALVRTARLDLDEGYLARGLPVAQRAAEVARLAKHPALEVESLTILSEILRDLGDIQGAINACERALKVTEAAPNLPPRARAEVLRAKGILLRYGGRVHEAVSAYAEAIAVFRAVGARRAEARVKNSLAFAMFVLERFEDAIAVALDSLSIDLSIGGRFQMAKTLSNVGQAYARLGDMNRGLAYMKRARDAHERYGDQDSRADTLLCSAAILLEAGDVDAAHTLSGDAGALVAVTGSAYDSAHERIVRAVLARTQGDAEGAITLATAGRKLAESQGLVSYHAYATAIEAVARVDAGELHTGVLLARTALGVVEATPSEFGIEVRALACEALRKGSPANARDTSLRALAHVKKVANFIRDPRLRALFLQRPLVDRILAEAEMFGADVQVVRETLLLDSVPPSVRAAGVGQLPPVPALPREATDEPPPSLDAPPQGGAE